MTNSEHACSTVLTKEGIAKGSNYTVYDKMDVLNTQREPCLDARILTFQRLGYANMVVCDSN